jgi:hypothetical protein
MFDDDDDVDDGVNLQDKNIWMICNVEKEQ